MTQEVLHAGIIELSESQNWWSAKQEWELETIYRAQTPQTCVCGHTPIIEICVIRNRLNSNQTEVGNVCVNNFLGLGSETLFASVRRVISSQSTSFNEEVLAYARRKGIISDKDLAFYSDIWRKRRLSEKQTKWKLDINNRILKHVQR